jgi:hypothetical protein
MLAGYLDFRLCQLKMSLLHMYRNTQRYKGTEADGNPCHVSEYNPRSQEIEDSTCT